MDCWNVGVLYLLFMQNALFPRLQSSTLTRKPVFRTAICSFNTPVLHNSNTPSPSKAEIRNPQSAIQNRRHSAPATIAR